MRPLSLTAWLNVALHLGGLAFAVAALRPGTPIVPPDDRVAYLAQRPLGWSLGWAAWMLCALALVAFLAVLARVVPEPSAALVPAVMLASAGAAVDLVCDTLYITVLPGLAAEGASPLFLTVERALGAAGAVVANGLYSVATLVATLALRARPQVPSFVRWLGYLTFAGGMLMVAAGFTGDPEHLQLATGATIVPYMAWTLGVARALRA
jgi:hypothetical protein